MYKCLLVLLSVVDMATATFEQQKQDMNSKQSNHKVLVAYFSATGTTARAAEKVADVTGGDLYAITPAQPYIDADLDWNDKQSRSSVEMNDPKARPALGGKRLDVSGYDVVFIGYPIWWDLAPRIIDTFIENHDLKGKTVVPFATSGSSSIAGSTATLKRAYPALNWKEGRLLNRADEKTIRTWIDRLGY
ncbi:flavodoxin [Parabacteroides distasonis]|uniref:Flavodoxin n=1 Tax=Parabacteroides distasonis TaxID=823 RepID=A0A7L5EH04_PARDI|nr:flavodoxin [Parabacteroides distasonis]QJE30034.1 flavodoxin [Parabacteroides distasonis]WRY45216.1 flavodoxin [Parabacteroides distasonis]